MANFASAYFDLGYAMDSAARAIQPVAQFFLGGFDYTGQLLFERFLIFLLIFSITFVALFKAPFFKDQKPAVIVISVIVPLLSVRYIDFMWMNTILMSYQVFGIALTSILPFIIYFFFLIGIAPPEQGHSGIRKIGWVLFACVYLGLYTTSDNQFYGQVYMWTALGAVLFFLIDGTIQKYFTEQKLKRHTTRSLVDRTVQLQKEINDLMAQGAGNPTNHLNWRLKEKSDEMKEIHKMISKSN
jgi:hypothetical protein